MAIDTNILAYAEGVNGDTRKIPALTLIKRLAYGTGVLPVQTLCELFMVLVRKAGWQRVDARNAILSWCDVFPLVETSQSVVVGALELATKHNVSLWDGIVLASAADSGCRFLLTEDLQEGFTWQGVTVANPFSKSPHPLLVHALQ
jgi:predicted nucleic acid-binding protein